VHPRAVEDGDESRCGAHLLLHLLWRESSLGVRFVFELRLQLAGSIMAVGTDLNITSLLMPLTIFRPEAIEERSLLGVELRLGVRS